MMGRAVGDDAMGGGRAVPGPRSGGSGCARGGGGEACVRSRLARLTGGRGWWAVAAVAGGRVGGRGSRD